jgi:anthranilate synthase component 1
MTVAVEGPEVSPSLEEVRRLAAEHTLVPLRHTFIDDCETPVSAYLKLRGDGPSFLLESAEQGQRFGRWSFLGFRPRAVIRLDDGRFTIDGEQRETGDPYAAVADELSRYRIAPTPACRRSSAARSACSATTSSAMPSRRSAPATRTSWARRTWR